MMDDDIKQPGSSLNNKIIIAFLMIIIVGGVLINLSFQYALKKTLTAEQLNEEVIRNISSNFISLSTGLTILGCIVALIISILLSRKITGPIKRLNEAVNKLANGRLYTRIDYLSDDEIGQLAEGFNRMAQELEEALKKSEAQREYAEGIVAAVPSTLVIVNDRYEIISTNIRLEKSGMSIRPKDVVYSLKRELFRCLKASECQKREITLKHDETGEPLTFIAEVSLIEKGKDGAIALISLTDITAMKRAEEELKRKVDELERFRRVTVKREIRMEELRRKAKELEQEVERLRAGKG